MNLAIVLKGHYIKWFEEGHKAGIYLIRAPDSNSKFGLQNKRLPEHNENSYWIL